MSVPTENTHTDDTQTMRAVLIRPGPEGGRLELTELPIPRPGPGQLLVRVHAASVNRADLAQRQGGHTPGIAAGGPLVAGLDAAGEVTDVGAGVDRFAPGDRVMAMAAGGYADYITVDARIAIPVPDPVSSIDAAAAVIALMTEHDALVRTGGLRAGQAVLIHGAGSGVGRTAVQLAAHLGAHPIITTVRRPDADDELRALGATDVLTTDGPDLAQAVLDRTEGRGVDLVVDHVGAPLLGASLRALAIGGHLVSVGRSVAPSPTSTWNYWPTNASPCTARRHLPHPLGRAVRRHRRRGHTRPAPRPGRGQTPTSDRSNHAPRAGHGRTGAHGPRQASRQDRAHHLPLMR